MAWQLLSGIFSALSLFCLLSNSDVLFFVYTIIGRGLASWGRHFLVLHMGPLSPTTKVPRKGPCFSTSHEFWRVAGRHQWFQISPQLVYSALRSCKTSQAADLYFLCLTMRLQSQASGVFSLRPGISLPLAPGIQFLAGGM